VAFEDIPGQERTKGLLRRWLTTGRIPHALLLSGMAGIGKAALARQFAKALLCGAGTSGAGCDRCRDCLRVASGCHPDLLWLRPEGQFIKIEQVRALTARLRFPPFESRWRIIVIEDAQALREDTANALLKMLEEPPKANLFVLLTLEPQMLLPTLVSRCCQVRLQPLDEATIARELVARGCSGPSEAHEISRLAMGSLQRAEALVDGQVLARYTLVVERVAALAASAALDFFQLAAEWAKEGADLDQDLEHLQLWLRDLLVLRLTGLSPADALCVAAAADVWQRLTVDELLGLYQVVEQGRQHLRRNASKQLTLEVLCLALKDRWYGESGGNPFSLLR
jgi:DNA polymerase-3 subunit delta'